MEGIVTEIVRIGKELQAELQSMGKKTPPLPPPL